MEANDMKCNCMNIVQDFQTYLSVLRDLCESMDDFLFLREIGKDRNHFFGTIGDRYALQKSPADAMLSVNTLQDIARIVHPKDRSMFLRSMTRIDRGECSAFNLNLRWLDRGNHTVWVNYSGKVFLDANGKPAVVAGRVSDTVLKHRVDALTGLFNKMKMTEDMEGWLASGKTGYLMILGVDNLKSHIRRNSWEYGNGILREVAKALEDVLGTVQRIFRLDGDYFGVFLMTDNPNDVLEVYEKLREKLAVVCTISAGAVSCREVPRADAGMLYQFAEDALDQAKQNGKNCLKFFTREYYEQQMSELWLLETIRESVKNGCRGFSLYYQSQVNSQTHRLFGAEALLRYETPERGWVFPDEFIPMLEKTGMICQVGMWVLETALEHCKQWRKVLPSFHVSVNISYVQLKEPDIAEKVLEALERCGLPGEALTLEVTESMQLKDYTYFNRIFEKWRAAGITISVDDFGTGYSSLSYLKSLKIDEIKIDRCFVNGLQSDGYNYRLLYSMLELAKNSKIRVCCEGVEKEEQVEILEKLNPNLLQGYLFAKPCDWQLYQLLYIDSNVLRY